MILQASLPQRAKYNAWKTVRDAESRFAVETRWDEKAGLQTGCGVRSQVIDVPEAQVHIGGKCSGSRCAGVGASVRGKDRLFDRACACTAAQHSGRVCAGS